MCGKNCGTVPSPAWRVLGDGIDASVAITDLESHDAVESLRAGGVAGGPCGAAPLATLRKLSRDSTRKSTLGLGSESVLVLFCTEGARPYDVPGESSLQGLVGRVGYIAQRRLASERRVFAGPSFSSLTTSFCCLSPFRTYPHARLDSRYCIKVLASRDHPHRRCNHLHRATYRYYINRPHTHFLQFQR